MMSFEGMKAQNQHSKSKIKNSEAEVNYIWINLIIYYIYDVYTGFAFCRDIEPNGVEALKIFNSWLVNYCQNTLVHYISHCFDFETKVCGKVSSIVYPL